MLIPIVPPILLPRLQFLYSSGDLGSGSSKTANSVPFGVASVDRLLVFGIAHAVAGTVAITGATIGGVTATQAAQSAGTNTRAALFYANVPAGTTGSITATFGSSISRTYFSLWSLKSLNSFTPIDTDSPAGGLDAVRSVSLDTQKNGAAIVLAVNGAPIGSFTGATLDYSDAESAGGSSHPTAAASGVSISATCRAICGASWR